MNSASRTLSTSLFTLVLAACGDGGSDPLTATAGVTATDPGTTSETTPQTTTGADTTTDA